MKRNLIPEEVFNSSNAVRSIARIVNQMELPPKLPAINPIDYKKITHKLTERKVKPRSYRLAESAETKLKKIVEKLGLDNTTTGVEVCIHAVAERLNLK